jgi:predicted pyridoxine 5'-phosphate oxidase superfamily flavin-nucleotide-binding protein
MGILTDDMKRIVREQRLGFVATVCADGTPNLSPKGTTAVWGDEYLVFADIRSPATVANLRRNAAVEVNVVDPILRKGYRFKGTAEILAEGELFQELFDFYRRNPRIRNIVLIKVKEALPLISPAYDEGVSEDQVRARFESWYASLKGGKSGKAPEE